MEKITNTTIVLSFELEVYYPIIPIYAIVLDFIFETGGVS